MRLCRPEQPSECFVVQWTEHLDGSAGGDLGIEVGQFGTGDRRPAGEQDPCPGMDGTEHRGQDRAVETVCVVDDDDGRPGRAGPEQHLEGGARDGRPPDADDVGARTGGGDEVFQPVRPPRPVDPDHHGHRHGGVRRSCHPHGGRS